MSWRIAPAVEEILVRFFHLQKNPFPAFDLICLGLGKDGHTASLFPGQGAIEEGERPAVHVKGGDPFVERITLTLPVLNRGRRVVFLVTGKEKSEIVRKVLIEKPETLPACRVRPLNGELLWFLDRAAAGSLHGP